MAGPRQTEVVIETPRSETCSRLEGKSYTVIGRASAAQAMKLLALEER